MDASHAVRAARRHAGSSQRAFAGRAGVSARTVASIEAGTVTPSLATMQALLSAAGLELSLDRELPEPCDHLQRYLQFSLTERLYLSLGGTWQPRYDGRLSVWVKLSELSRHHDVMLDGLDAVGVWVPGVRPALPIAVSVRLRTDAAAPQPGASSGWCRAPRRRRRVAWL